MSNDNQNSLCCKNVGFNLVIFSSLLSILIAKDLSVNDQNLLSALLQSMGQNLAVIATVQENCEEKNQDNTKSS